MSNSILAWHFSTGELDFDYKGTTVEAGLKLNIHERPVLKYKGFHASFRPSDALKFFTTRPNPDNKIIVSRVRLSGEIVSDGYRYINIPSDWEQGVGERIVDHTLSTNIVAQHREHLWVADAGETCRNLIDECYSEIFHLIGEISLEYQHVATETLHKLYQLPLTATVNQTLPKDLQQSPLMTLADSYKLFARFFHYLADKSDKSTSRLLTDLMLWTVQIRENAGQFLPNLEYPPIEEDLRRLEDQLEQSLLTLAPDAD